MWDRVYPLYAMASRRERSRSPKAGRGSRVPFKFGPRPSQRSKFKFSALTSKEGIRRTLASMEEWSPEEAEQTAIAIAERLAQEPRGTFATIELDADEKVVYIEPPYNYHWKKPE